MSLVFRWDFFMPQRTSRKIGLSQAEISDLLVQGLLREAVLSVMAKCTH